MKLHEYQAKGLFREFGIAVPNGQVAENLAQAKKIIDEATAPVLVVKAQVHAGGRGKAGGVKVAKTKGDAEKYAKDILGMTLVTHQTGPEGILVKKIYIEEGSNIDRELYLAILVDRSVDGPVIIASSEGGMEIEEVAEKHPEKIFKERVETLHLYPFVARKLAAKLNIKGPAANEFANLVTRAVEMFYATDCAMLEINPLVITKESKVMALDGKVLLDDNGLIKHSKLADLRDISEEDPLEVEASRFSLNYVKLDGNIGCMVNGAGLAMATMDIIKLFGGEPANFLDVGGGANAEQVKNAMKILLSDKNVKGVFINIFGGIMRCDIIAQGVLDAYNEAPFDLPIVMRLRGTNLEEGKALLASSKLKFAFADDMNEAASKIVEMVK